MTRQTTLLALLLAAAGAGIVLVACEVDRRQAAYLAANPTKPAAPEAAEASEASEPAGCALAALWIAYGGR